MTLVVCQACCAGCHQARNALQQAWGRASAHYFYADRVLVFGSQNLLDPLTAVTYSAARCSSVRLFPISLDNSKSLGQVFGHCFLQAPLKIQVDAREWG